MFADRACHRSRDRGRRPTAALVSAALAAAAVCAAPPAAARPAVQAPPATAVPRPPPSGAGISGPLPGCVGELSAEPRSANLRVGDLVTVTARARFDCPRLLEHRGVVIVVGTVPFTALAGARESLDLVVDAVAAVGTSRVAVIDVAAPDAPLDWAATPDALAATAARLRSLAPREVRGVSRWLAALDAADAALRALPPTLQPMLVVADGSYPAGDIEAAVRRLIEVVASCHDATGHSVLIGLSSMGWFELPAAIDPAFDSRAIIVRPTGLDADGGLPLGVAQVLAAFQASVERLQIVLAFTDRADVLAPVRVEPPPSDVGTGLLVWDPPAAGYAAAAGVSVTLRAGQPSPRTSMILSAAVARANARVRDARSVPMTICIDAPAPAPAQCAAAVTPTATPGTGPPGPTRPPTRGPVATATPGPPSDRAPLFVPLAHRLR